MIKSQMTSVYFANIGKTNKVLDIMREITRYKTAMSLIIYNNRKRLLFDKNLKSLDPEFNKNFDSDNIPKWNLQTEYAILKGNYKDSFDKLIKNKKFEVQTNISITKYKKKTKRHSAGDVKDFKIHKKSTMLCQLVKYLVYVDLSHPSKIRSIIKNPTILTMIKYFSKKKMLKRIINLAILSQNNIIKRIKLIEFPNELSSFRLSGGPENTAYILKDSSNTKYKDWFSFKMYKKNRIILPIQINNKYHKLSDWNTKYFVVSPSIKGNKINISATIDEPDPKFSNQTKVEGLDFNIKHNFAVMSDKKTFDFDREFFGNILKDLQTLDEIGMQNLSDSQLKKLKRLYRRLEWFVNLEIHEIIKYCKNNNISDLVIENLLFMDRLGVINEEFNVKYSRLLKLLHLSKVKHYLRSQGEKNGIRVHITSSRYTSITCECGNISHSNRKTQEEFYCEECGVKENADLHSGKNLKGRFVSNVLRNKLHTIDRFNRLQPRKLSKYSIYNILETYYTERYNKLFNIMYNVCRSSTVQTKAVL